MKIETEQAQEDLFRQDGVKIDSRLSARSRFDNHLSLANSFM